MFVRNKNKSRERYYLLPGQGGKNFYRKRRKLIGWSIGVAVLLGGVLSAAMWWWSKPIH